MIGLETCSYLLTFQYDIGILFFSDFYLNAWENSLTFYEFF